MKNLTSAELYKLFRLPIYKFLLILEFVIVTFDSLVLYKRIEIGADWIYCIRGRFIWNVILIFVMSADFVGKDFSNRTFLTGLLCGEPRWKLILSKGVAIFVGSLPLMAVFELTGVIMATLRNGFGMPLSVDVLILVADSNIYCILHDLIFVCVALLMSLIIKNKLCLVLTGTCVVYALYVLIANMRFMEDAVRGVLHSILKFCIIYQGVVQVDYLDIHIPFWLVISSSAVTIILVSLATAYVFSKQDLK